MNWCILQASRRSMGKNKNRHQRQLSGDLIIVLSDSEDDPTPKRFKYHGPLDTFSTPLHTSTPIESRTTKSLPIQCGMKRRSSSPIILPFGIDDPPIEIDDYSSIKEEHSEIEQSETQNQVQVVLEKMTPEYIQRMMNNVNDVTVSQAQPLNVQPNVSQIDVKSWLWQPHLKLKRIKKNDLDGLLVKQHEFLKSKTAKVQPAKLITFDREESVIREISPDRAAKTFQQVNASYSISKALLHSNLLISFLIFIHI